MHVLKMYITEKLNRIYSPTRPLYPHETTKTIHDHLMLRSHGVSQTAHLLSPTGRKDGKTKHVTMSHSVEDTVVADDKD